MRNNWAKLSPRNGGSLAGGSSCEVLRLRFHQPREHFLDRRDSSFAGRLLERFVQELEVHHPVVREREEERRLAELNVFNLPAPRTFSVTSTS